MYPSHESVSYLPAAALEKWDGDRGRPEMAEQFTALYKQLWLLAGGIVGLTGTLVKLIP